MQWRPRPPPPRLRASLAQRAAWVGSLDRIVDLGGLVPGGSKYTGPPDALALYTEVVDSSAGDAEVKGAKNPYTSRNGHMFSFLIADGTMALRLPDDLWEEFVSRYDSGPVMQYGSVMRGYVSVPDSLFNNKAEIGEWFDKSYDWIGTLEPK